MKLFSLQIPDIACMIMKHMSKIILILIVATAGFQNYATAYDFRKDTVYYQIVSGKSELSVVNHTGFKGANSYSGDIIIPSNVTYNNVEYTVSSIGPSAFSGCSSLKTVKLPQTIKTINPLAFYASTITRIVIPDSVTVLNYMVFNRCSKLRSVSLPASLKTFYNSGYQFAGCVLLDTLYLGFSLPPVLPASNVFSGVNLNSCKVFIPAGTLSNFNDSTVLYWRDFKNYIEVDSKWSGNANWTEKLASTSSGAGNKMADIEISSGNVGVDTLVEVNGLTLKAGSGLKVNVGKKLISRVLTIESNATDGTATFVNNGTVNIANGTLKQYLPGGRTFYMSSPITNALSGIITSNSSNMLGYYDEPSGSFVQITDHTTALDPGKGYLVKLAASGTIAYTGNLNDNVITIPLTNSATTNTGFHGYNLVGNPYPSYLDWESVTKSNSDITMWTRSKNTSGAYVFDTYNGSSHLGTNNNGNAALTRYIPPMQGFWVKVPDGQTTGTLVLDNSMRYHRDQSANRLKVQGLDQPKVLRMNVSCGSLSDEAILTLDSKAQHGLDDFDSEKLSNNNPLVPEISTIVEGKRMVINGLPTDFTDMEIPMSFKTGQIGSFSFNVTQMDNLGDYRIYFIDYLKGISTQLLTGIEYAFDSGVDDTNDRFSLRFQLPGTVTDSKSNLISDDLRITSLTSVSVSFQVSDTYMDGNFEILDMTGRVIQKGMLESNLMIVENLQPNQIFILRVFDREKSIQIKFKTSSK